MGGCAKRETWPLHKARRGLCLQAMSNSVNKVFTGNGWVREQGRRSNGRGENVMSMTSSHSLFVQVLTLSLDGVLSIMSIFSKSIDCLCLQGATPGRNRSKGGGGGGGVGRGRGVGRGGRRGGGGGRKETRDCARKRACAYICVKVRA